MTYSRLFGNNRLIVRFGSIIKYCAVDIGQNIQDIQNAEIKVADIGLPKKVWISQIEPTSNDDYIQIVGRDLSKSIVVITTTFFKKGV